MDKIRDIEYFNEFLTENKNKLLIDILYFMSRNKYLNFNSIRNASNNRLPTKYINYLKKENIIKTYNLNKKQELQQLKRNGVGLYHIKKMKFYQLETNILNIILNSKKILSKIKKYCINRFAKRRLKQLEAKRIKQKQEKYIQDRNKVFDNISLSDIIKDINLYLLFAKHKIYTLKDYYSYDIQSLSKLTGLSIGSSSYIQNKTNKNSLTWTNILIGKYLSNKFNFNTYK